jgi:hypothetical protein
MRDLVLAGPFALLLLLPATAQSPGGFVRALEQPPSSVNCPVDFSAAHQRTGGTVQVSRGASRQGQAFEVRFQPLHGPGIVEAAGVLHGLAGAQLLPTGRPQPGDVTEFFHTGPLTAQSGRFESVVYAGRITGVRWIELTEIAFADGTRWRATADSICRAVPNGMMLVASQPLEH